ncbi:RDD family protein [Dactylosporangium matsuzakiense]|uniref:Transporter n=1 Tax=Dactylosporangium matsuzakiense TaxID=53360 RepID=A0A9W6NSQ9_9ACTN|nr:RDD family protein [Dactylosporangium matsuzakiense]UWZ44115.1 RDD family protein [Dactylosporangium matsuzakiense]GLL07407.1 transporter [Dactylosporangium matsuzakiense]
MTDTAAPGERLVSGEAVELEVRVARAGSRVLALMLDIVLQCLLLQALVMITAIVVYLTLEANIFDGGLLQAIVVILMVVTLIGYPVFWETILRGRTPGKAAMGLRVVRDDGGPVRFRHALTRALVGFAIEWPGLLFPVVSWLGSLGVLMLNPSGKRIGDLVAGTIVIHERTPAGWGWVPAMPPPLTQWARNLDLTGLDDSLALAVRHFLARNREIGEPARTALGQALAREVAACTTPPPPPNVPGWAYLAAVLAERHRRASRRLARARAASAAVWPGLYTAITPRILPPSRPQQLGGQWAPLQPPPDQVERRPHSPML